MSCRSALFNSGIACWGDSLTRGVGTASPNRYIDRLSVLSGKYVYNAGIGGEDSTQILARFQAAPDKWQRATIIWSGRNNPNAPLGVLGDVDLMVSALGHQRFLVLSVIGMEGGAAEYVGGSTYNNIATINAGFASAYGVRYVDVRSHLISLYNPAVPQDVTDHANDIPPSSLRADTVHLNAAGYQAVADKIYESIGLLYP